MGTQCCWGSWVYCYWDVAQSFYLTLSHSQDSRDLSGGMNNRLTKSAQHCGVKSDSKDCNSTCHRIRISGDSPLLLFAEV